MDPDAKPNIKANTMDSALIVGAEEGVVVRSEAGSHRVMVMAVQITRAAIMLLKRPSLSATYPGSARPMLDPAFIIAISW